MPENRPYPGSAVAASEREDAALALLEERGRGRGEAVVHEPPFLHALEELSMGQSRERDAGCAVGGAEFAEESDEAARPDRAFRRIDVGAQEGDYEALRPALRKGR